MHAEDTNAATLRASARRPWLGLRSFAETDADYYFGRRREIGEFIQRVLRQPLTVLYSQSGLGKTSLIAAGLIPALRDEGRRPVMLRLRFDDDAPTLLQQVQEALNQVLPAPDETVTASASLWARLHRLSVTTHSEFRHNPPVLLFDQFEELFTLGAHRRPEEVAQCLNELAELVENRVPSSLLDHSGSAASLNQHYDLAESPLRLVLSLREDYIFQLDAWRGPMPSVMRNRMALAMLSGPQALEAVLRPASYSNPPLITENAAEAIVRFVARASPETELEDIVVVPPLLSLVCAELNEARLHHAKTAIEEDDVVGNADQILIDFYERCFAGHPPMIRQIIEEQLITKSGHRDSRARESFEADLAIAGIAHPPVVLEEFVQQHRLLSIDRRSHQQRIELTHDVIAGIVFASREKRHERESSERASEALALETAKTRKRRRQMVTLACLTCIALGGAVFGLWQARAANKALEELRNSDEVLNQRIEADTRGALGRAKERLDFSDTNTAFAHYADALRHSLELPEGELKQEVADYWGDHLLGMKPLQSIPIVGPLDHEDKEVFDIAYSNDGNYLVTTCESGPVRIWEAKTGKEVLQLPDEINNAYAAAFSADDRLLAVAGGESKLATVWKIDLKEETRERIGAEMQHEGAVMTAEFSRDGKFIVTACWDGKVRVWDAVTGEAKGPAHPQKHSEGIYEAHMSEDGLRLLTASADMTSGYWSSTEPTLPIFTPHPAAVLTANFVTFDKVITACDDGKARLIDPGTGTEIANVRSISHKYLWQAQPSNDGLRVLTASASQLRLSALWASAWFNDTSNAARMLNTSIYGGNRLRAACLSPDGRSVATGDHDGKVFLWHTVPDCRPGFSPSLRLRQEGRARGVCFAPDGLELFVGGANGAVQRWDARSGLPLGEPLMHTDSVQTLSLNAVSSGTNPHDFQLVTTDFSPLAYHWNAATGTCLEPPLQHESKVLNAAFSTDGKIIVTTTEGKKAILWNAQTHQQQRTLLHADGVYDARFSHDDQHLVTAAGVHATVWSMQSDEGKGEPLPHASKVTCCAFHPKNHDLILTGTKSGELTLWTRKNGQWGIPWAVPGSGEEICALSFSPDGERLATVATVDTSDQNSTTHAVYVRDIATGNFHYSVNLPSGGLGVAFAPDGQRIALTSFDGTTRLIDLGPTQVTPPSDDLRHWAQSSVSKEDGTVIGVTLQERMEWRDRILSSNVDTEWQRFLRWKLADPTARTVTYHSDVSVADYIERELTWAFNHGDPGRFIVFDAHDFDPMHPLIHVALGVGEAEGSYWRKRWIDYGLQLLERYEKETPRAPHHEVDGSYRAKAAVLLYLQGETQRAKEVFSELLSKEDGSGKLWADPEWVKKLDKFYWPPKFQDAILELNK